MVIRNYSHPNTGYHSRHMAYGIPLWVSRVFTPHKPVGKVTERTLRSFLACEKRHVNMRRVTTVVWNTRHCCGPHTYHDLRMAIFRSRLVRQKCSETAEEQKKRHVIYQITMSYSDPSPAERKEKGSGLEPTRLDIKLTPGFVLEDKGFSNFPCLEAWGF